MSDQRLDAALAQRGLARSRTHAQELLDKGLVRVDGKPVIKAAHKVSEANELSVEGLDHYVSRAAHKLIAALDDFDLDIRGRQALDVGASTGGFTQVLLERGVAHVVALDVGHNQISTKFRGDERVTIVEGVNARYLTSANLAGILSREYVPNLVVADLSFISLTHVIPAMIASASADADFVLLIKPQFEVGRTGVREGIVTNAALREDAINAVLWNAWDSGLETVNVISSPILGGAGNHEYIAWFRAGREQNPSQWRDTVHRLAGGARG
jgi:23S rRNA (cytidine1920-2'-O)/16S rRNA (cytidine1409-2'-O)-methyltransferase